MGNKEDKMRDIEKSLWPSNWTKFCQLLEWMGRTVQDHIAAVLKEDQFLQSNDKDAKTKLFWWEWVEMDE